MRNTIFSMLAGPMRSIFLFVVILFTVASVCAASKVNTTTRMFRTDVFIDGGDTIPIFFYHYYDQFYDSTRVRFMIGELLHAGGDTAFFRIDEYAPYPFNDVLTASNESEMADSSISGQFVGKSGDEIYMYREMTIQNLSDTATVSENAIWMGVKDTVVFYLDIIDSTNTILQVLDTIGVRPFDNLFEEYPDPIFIENGPVTENDTAFQKRYVLNIGSDAKTVRLRVRPHLGSPDGLDRFGMQRTGEYRVEEYTQKNLYSRNMIIQEMVTSAGESPCAFYWVPKRGIPNRNITPNPYAISIVPSPVDAMATITIYNPIRENINNAECWIVDIKGRVVKKFDVNGVDSGLSVEKIDFSGWPSGSYLVYFTSGMRVLAKESFVIVH